MRNTFSPLILSYLGFDRLFSEIDSMLDSASTRSLATSYPPLNLLKEENGDYLIEMALAGFRKEDIQIEHDKKHSVLTIVGDTSARKVSDSKGIKTRSEKKEEPTSTSTDLVTSESLPRAVILKQGIAARTFIRAFTIADDLEVSEAELVDGMLTVKLKKVETPESKPLRIELK